MSQVLADNSYELHEIAGKIANDETYRNKISKGIQVSVERPRSSLCTLYISKDPEKKEVPLEAKYFQKNDTIGYLHYSYYNDWWNTTYETRQIYAPIDGKFIPKDELLGKDISDLTDENIQIGIIYSDEHLFYTNYRDEIDNIVKSILNDRELRKKQKEDEKRREKDAKRKEKEEQKRLAKDAVDAIGRCMLPIDAAIEKKEKIEFLVLDDIEKSLQNLSGYRDSNIIIDIESEIEHYKTHFESVYSEYIKYPIVSNGTAEKMSIILDRFQKLLGCSFEDIELMRNERKKILDEKKFQEHIAELALKLDEAISGLQVSWQNSKTIDDVYLKVIDDTLHELLQEKNELNDNTLIEKSQKNLELFFCDCRDSESVSEVTKKRMAGLLDIFNEVIGMTTKRQGSLASEMEETKRKKMELDNDREIKSEAYATMKNMFTSYLQSVSENHQREVEALLKVNQNRKEKFLASLEGARAEKKQLLELSREAKGQEKQNYLDESRELEETIRKLQTEDKEADEMLAGNLAMLRDKQRKEMQENPIKLTNIDTFFLGYTGDEQK